MHMDDTKIFAKNNKEQKTLMRTIRIYSQDIGMEFGAEKCAMLIMKKDKRETTKELNQKNQKSIRTRGDKENYKYSGILEADTI